MNSDAPANPTEPTDNAFPAWTVPPVPNQSAAVNWNDIEESRNKEDSQQEYYPLADTLRLYAGWQLALYLTVYTLGMYQSQRELSFRIPYIDALYLSPVLLTFTLICFLFLVSTSFHRTCGRKKVFGWLFTLLGIAVFLFYRANVDV